MPNFSMCTDDDCPFRIDCQRSMSSGTIPDPRKQIWSLFRITGDGKPDYPNKCTGWLPVPTYEEQR